MAKSADDKWLAQFLEVTGILNTVEIAAGRLRQGLPQIIGRGNASRKSEIEARFDQALSPQKVVDAFLAEITSGLSLREDLLPNTVNRTGAHSFLTDIHHTTNGAILRNDFATARDEYLALTKADPEAAFVFETFAGVYGPFRSLISTIAYPAMKFDFAILEAKRRATPPDRPFAYEIGPVGLDAMRETDALTAAFIHGGLKDRTHRDLLLFATFLASDDGSQMLFVADTALETAVDEPLAEMLIPFVDDGENRSQKP